MTSLGENAWDFQAADDELGLKIAAKAEEARPAFEAASRQVVALQLLLDQSSALLAGELPIDEFSVTDPPSPAIALMLEQRTAKRRTASKPTSPPNDFPAARRLVSYELGRVSDRLSEIREVLDRIARGLTPRSRTPSQQARSAVIT